MGQRRFAGGGTQVCQKLGCTRILHTMAPALTATGMIEPLHVRLQRKRGADLPEIQGLGEGPARRGAKMDSRARSPCWSGPAGVAAAANLVSGLTCAGEAPASTKPPRCRCAASRRGYAHHIGSRGRGAESTARCVRVMTGAAPEVGGRLLATATPVALDCANAWNSLVQRACERWWRSSAICRRYRCAADRRRRWPRNTGWFRAAMSARGCAARRSCA
ncbi:hypothetical protein GALL_351280 [mine drainage metagenome]|uniref:Uncharacterized protein n=1 Tax=mine drainage metagenome TaxID=410659 RepID=A0A1J5QHZ4_9ZZZZ